MRGRVLLVHWRFLRPCVCSPCCPQECVPKLTCASPVANEREAPRPIDGAKVLDQTASLRSRPRNDEPDNKTDTAMAPSGLQRLMRGVCNISWHASTDAPDEHRRARRRTVQRYMHSPKPEPVQRRRCRERDDGQQSAEERDAEQDSAGMIELHESSLERAVSMNATKNGVPSSSTRSSCSSP